MQSEAVIPPPMQPVIIQQPVIMSGPLMFGRYPQAINCPMCRAQVTTRVIYKSGGGTWLICVGLFLIGCQLGCCFIPFCVDGDFCFCFKLFLNYYLFLKFDLLGAKDAQHYCPNCNALLGSKSLL